MLFLRAACFYCGLSLVTCLFLPIALLAFCMPFSPRFYIVSRWSKFNLWWLKVTCGLSYDVQGLEHVPMMPAVVMCKHQSAWETLALQHIFIPQTWVLKRELLSIPIYGWALRSLEPVAIDRSSERKALRQILKQGKMRLQRGIWMVIFPEGTRIAPRQRKNYQIGGGMLAVHAGVPVIPVAHNAGYFWPKNSWIKYPGCITLVIGSQIDTQGKSAAEVTKQAEQWIEDTIMKLPSPSHDNGNP